ncbi:MAG: hypothetical protein A2Y07_01240 [Planctomycetes bacterium GWF2_50_10]|nr:MAG: hypothetical protein A2Y07_01240 [Planctomycetes bacterium GWF2_50_10]
MSINPLNLKQLTKLREAVTYSRQKLQPFRDARINALRQYVGRHYSDNGATDKVPVNLLELAINIYMQQLAARPPKVLATTPFFQLKPSALNLELATNAHIAKIKLANHLRLAVIDAMFALGIIKTGLTRSTPIEIDGVMRDPGKAFAEVVHLDDWVHDVTARIYEECQFAGNRYRIGYELAMELFSGSGRDELKPDEVTGLNETGDERAESISRGGDNNPATFKDTVELWDLWLPDEKLLVTMPVEGSGKALQILEWSGPENGPYHLLSFSPVPGNVMPLPPVALWMDLHDLANRIFRKLGRQAERQKTLLGVRTSGQKDGDNVIRADDGEAITMDDPKNAQEYNYGGIRPESLAFLIQLKDMFAYFAGNLDSLGGLSPQADTLGQDQLLSANASKRVLVMQDRMIEFTTEIVTDIAGYIYDDPITPIPVIKAVKGADVQIQGSFEPEERVAPFNKYNFEIEPYSMQYQGPAARLQALTQIFTNFLVPFAPMLSEQGIAINFRGLLSIISRYGNMPELDELLVMQEPLSNSLPGPVGMPKSPVTRRTYERINRPGATRQGKDSAMVNLLMGSKNQPAQNAQLVRSIG